MAHAFEFSDRMRMATKVHKRDKASAVQSFAERRGLARKSVHANNSEVGNCGNVGRRQRTNARSSAVMLQIIDAFLWMQLKT